MILHVSCEPIFFQIQCRNNLSLKSFNLGKFIICNNLQEAFLLMHIYQLEVQMYLQTFLIVA